MPIATAAATAASTNAAATADGLQQDRPAGRAVQRTRRQRVRGLLLQLESLPDERVDQLGFVMHRWQERVLPPPVQALLLRRDLPDLESGQLPLRQHPIALPPATAKAPANAVAAAGSTTSPVAATAATLSATTADGLRQAHIARRVGQQEQR